MLDSESFFKGFWTAIKLGRHFVMGLISKFITRNGTYIAANDGADGYSTVTVDVTPEFTAADEGKVVENGALVAQTSLTVTENGTYDTTTNDEVVVNVSGGGAVVSDNDLLFHFDGNYENSGKTQAVMSNVTGYQLSSEQSKFGGTSLKVASAPNYSLGAVFMPYDFSIGLDDFTLDFWMYQTSNSTAASCAFSFTYRSFAYYSKTGTMRGVTVASSHSAWDVDRSTSTETLNIRNGWHHVAITRENGTVRVFVDGVMEDSFSFTASFPSMSKLSFGTNSTSDTSWRGYIDEFRLKIGEAVWTENFTPPDTPYT